MQKIESFKINHDVLMPGMYVSRIDGDITTYDLRTRRPNLGDYMDNVTMHSVEHMLATLLRNSEIASDIIYFGPMGCRTGFYLLLAGDYESKDILDLMREMYAFIRDFEGEVPGASAKDCGNYLDMNLGMAKYLASRYLDQVLTNTKPEQLTYPQEALRSLSQGQSFSASRR